MGGQGREGSVGWAGSREPPPQNIGGCQHLASPQSTCAEYQGGPATDLAVSVSHPPPRDVGWKDSTAPRGASWDLCPQSLQLDEDEGTQSASTAF